jgi:3-dehydroquinate dehydratase
MAYSRWTTSVWYTFGTLKDGLRHPEKRSDWYFAIFCDSVESIGGFSYDALKKDIDKCIFTVKEAIDGTKNPVITEKELNELKEYMLEFVEEVDRDYKN